MELTNILGQSFLVNVDSVVYAYERGDEATLLLSKGGVLVDVQESVADVVTASDSGLTAFTATSGDVTGDIAVNPNYIITVTSADSGDASTLVIGDNTATRATVTVDTDYADMDAIIEAASGGGSSYSVYTAILTQSGTSAPVATVLQNTLGGTVVWTRNDVGDYTGTLAGVFTANKTGCLIAETGGLSFLGRADSDEVHLITRDEGGISADEYLIETMVEIRVYP